MLKSLRRVRKSFLNSFLLSKITFLDLGQCDNQVLLNIWLILTLVFSVIPVISNQPVTGFINVIAFRILSLSFWSVTVQGPTKSIQPVSQGISSTFLGGNLPYFFFFFFFFLNFQQAGHCFTNCLILSSIFSQQRVDARDRKSTRLNSSHPPESRMPSSA